MRLPIVLVSALIAGFSLFSYPQPTLAADSTDVLASVHRLEDELEIVRAYLGKDKSDRREFRVQEATTRHSFFLAQRIFSKLSVLIQETAGGASQSLPVAPNRTLVADDVLGVLQQAHEQIQFIKDEYGIKRTVQSRQRPRNADEAANVTAMVRSLRQINLMLVRRYMARDVYERVDLATVYVAGVLKNQNAELYPSIAFAAYKQPVDVFHKLLDCADLSMAIADLASVDALRLDTRRMRATSTRLSTNHDMATILLSDIAEWTAVLEGADDVFPESSLQSHVVPSHVFQKASQLEAQLRTVLENMK